MPKRDYGYIVPSPVDPLTRKCVQIFIPDSQLHIAAFWGALNTLSVNYSWENSESEGAKLASEIWREVIASARQTFENSEECTSQVEFRLTGGNVIEWRPDPYSGWINLGIVCPCDESNLIPIMSYNPDTVTAEEMACTVAVGMVTWLMEKYNDVLDAIEFATSVASAVDAILLIFPPAYLLADVITDAIFEVTNATVAACRAADTVEFREELGNWLYCEMIATNGELTSEIWDAFKQALNDGDFGISPTNVALHSYFSTFDYDAINARARIESYGAPQNCAAFTCGDEWLQEFDFTTGDTLGWEKRATSDPNFSAVNGSGLIPVVTVNGVNSERLAYLKRAMPYANSTTRIDEIKYEWVGMVPGNNTASNLPAVRMSTMNAAQTFIEGDGAGVKITALPSGDRTVVLSGTYAYLSTDFIRLYFSWGARTASPAVNSVGYISKITVRGTGKNPFIVE